MNEIERELKKVLGGLEQMEEMQRRLAEVRGVGHGADGLVRVEVGASGALADLTLDPRAMRLDSHSLREAILSASAMALENVAAELNDIVSGLLPDNAGFGEFLTGQGPLQVPTPDGGSTADPVAEVRRTLEQLRRDLA